MSMTREQVLAVALPYALREWAWDDATVIEELLLDGAWSYMDAEEVHEAVDNAANDFDLQRPSLWR